jgi:hypothetical protein
MSEDVVERPPMLAPKLVQRPVIRLQAPGQKAESQVFANALLEPPRRGHLQRVGVQPHLQQQLRRIRRPPLIAVAGLERRQIQPLDALVDEASQVIFAQLVAQPRRQKPGLLGGVIQKARHALPVISPSPFLKQSAPAFSHRL